jgi:hypothetical protein
MAKWGEGHADRCGDPARKRSPATNLFTYDAKWLHVEGQRLALSIAALVSNVILTALFAVSMSDTAGDMARFLQFIPEAGMRFGLLGSLITWTALAALALGSGWVFHPEFDFAQNIDAIARRMGVVMVVAIQGIHLAQRLLIDIRIEKVITNKAMYSRPSPNRANGLDVLTPAWSKKS